MRRMNPLGSEDRSPRHILVRSPGFTLVELLVTITIITIAIVLLIPSLSRARETSRRIACLNNLSQLGKALAAYDFAQGNLPGWRMELPGYTIASEENVSWAIAVLPYLGEGEAFSWYESFASGGATDDVREKRIARYICPSAVSAQTIPAALCYMGNGGTGAEVIRADGNQYQGDGVFSDMVGSGTYLGRKSSLSRAADGDGDGATLLMTERTGLFSPTNMSWVDQPLPAMLNANAVATTHLILHPPTAALVDGNPPIDPPSTVINPTATTTISNAPDWTLRYPSSRHDLGVCAVFCDGHTQFVSEFIAPWVYCQILTSDRRYRSPRAASWENYLKGASWVRYVLDQQDLNPKQ